ncbi:hypothetical protein CC1G_12947 [Coprinopsis cinerea okayama7|uniref:2OGFeDO JBP1/TET oxygenase domain-containing protein n=1 Tax=Coprinopsis cinerea (strain Okayama-7 / 130 / ATCC MYA-4618 / FGSC 9003) TaxID=240176 RepID=A8P064_COPC7|nr:hypothetical protein CC1G_12947 [Coprinopsis cinerea okayama7\|eukprot:XP_001837824.1 hypothetical protein CC1G_12947 [Coprinopsis cinerea okayama7\
MPTLPEFDLSAAAQLSFKMARYCQQLMKREIDSSWKGFPSLPVADGLDLSLRMEGLQLVRVVDEAHSNPVRLDWKFDDYAPHLVQAQLSGADPRLASLAARFPAPKGEPYRTQPHCIIDHAGVIGWWYLPGCISESRQRTIYHSVQRLSHMPCTPIQTTSQGNWRDHPDRFGSGAVVDGLKAGVATFSVCWFQRGHAGAEDFPAPSATLKDPKNHQFIKDMTESFAVLGAVLAVTQPWLFDAGMEVLENLHTKCISVNNSKVLDGILGFWSNPFTAFSVICNRETLIHRDLSSPQWCYDLVYTGGRYQNGRFESPTLGRRFLYDPGTVMVGLGNLIHHGVAPVEGDRFCIVSYFRSSMLERASHYRNAKAPTIHQLQNFYFQLLVDPPA